MVRLGGKAGGVVGQKTKLISTDWIANHRNFTHLPGGQFSHPSLV